MEEKTCWCCYGLGTLLNNHGDANNEDWYIDSCQYCSGTGFIKYQKVRYKSGHEIGMNAAIEAIMLLPIKKPGVR